MLPRGLMAKIGDLNIPHIPMTIYWENTQAVAIVKNPYYHTQTKRYKILLGTRESKGRKKTNKILPYKKQTADINKVLNVR